MTPSVTAPGDTKPMTLLKRGSRTSEGVFVLCGHKSPTTGNPRAKLELRARCQNYVIFPLKL